MANIKSAEKRIRVAAKKAARNKPLRTACKTYIKKADRVIASGDPQAAMEAVRAAISKLDSVADKGVIHKNNAARRKSRLMARYNKMLAAASSAEA